ncbi:hypothetical protein CSKR_107729 [Clonorchis sinensis]|uniref:Uncharacterized protein n=1 Tax=Clonorchis sinensis TaxID=79923 RepID=A0A3R7DNP4_CLOSI|nr:hypothetical protein CSKR_107729 [Clonorchis sinensis]
MASDNVLDKLVVSRYPPSTAFEALNKHSSAVPIQWQCRDLNPGHLTCEASVLPLLHQRTLDASEFSRPNRRTCSHLNDAIGVPDPSNDDPVTFLVVTIDWPANQDFPVRAKLESSASLWRGLIGIITPEQEDDR